MDHEDKDCGNLDNDNDKDKYANATTTTTTIATTTTTNGKDLPPPLPPLCYVPLSPYLGPSRIQTDIETSVLDLVSHYCNKTNAVNLCVVGGVGLYLVCNGRLVMEGIFDNVLLLPYPGDDGILLHLRTVPESV